jgi:hypothetical protein
MVLPEIRKRLLWKSYLTVRRGPLKSFPDLGNDLCPLGFVGYERLLREQLEERRGIRESDAVFP